jgi:hypothetical protein
MSNEKHDRTVRKLPLKVRALHQGSPQLGGERRLSLALSRYVIQRGAIRRLILIKSSGSEIIPKPEVLRGRVMNQTIER